jgi:hypothetical protein
VTSERAREERKWAIRKESKPANKQAVEQWRGIPASKRQASKASKKQQLEQRLLHQQRHHQRQEQQQQQQQQQQQRQIVVTCRKQRFCFERTNKPCVKIKKSCLWVKSFSDVFFWYYFLFFNGFLIRVMVGELVELKDNLAGLK